MLANAEALNILDTRLSQLEHLLDRVGTTNGTHSLVTPRPPRLELEQVKQVACERNGTELRSEREMLAVRLEAKRADIDGFNERVTVLRDTLLRNGCTDADRETLKALKAEIGAIEFNEDKRLADTLLDCTNTKILQGEAKKDSMLAENADSYAVVQMNKTLDHLNRFSREVLDLSISIGSAADLLDRLSRSTDKFDAMCSLDPF